MFRRVMYLLLMMILLCFAGSVTTVTAQSKSEGQRLFNEARQLEQKDKSKEGRQMSLQKYEEALTAIRKDEDVKLEAVALNNVGYIYSGLGDYSKAFGYFETSVEISKKTQNLKQEGRGLNGLATIFQHRGDYQKALENGEQALGIAKKTGDVQLEGQASNVIGNICLHSKQYPKALEHFQRYPGRWCKTWKQIFRAVGPQ